MLEPFTRTSFHHQPEAAAPENKLAGRLLCAHCRLRHRGRGRFPASLRFTNLLNRYCRERGLSGRAARGWSSKDAALSISDISFPHFASIPFGSCFIIPTLRAALLPPSDRACRSLQRLTPLALIAPEPSDVSGAWRPVRMEHRVPTSAASYLKGRRPSRCAVYPRRGNRHGYFCRIVYCR